MKNPKISSQRFQLLQSFDDDLIIFVVVVDVVVVVVVAAVVDNDDKEEEERRERRSFEMQELRSRMVRQRQVSMVDTR